MTATTGGTNNKVSKNFGAKSAAASAADPARVAGEGEGSPAPREVIVEGRPCLVTNVSQEADAWCAREVDLDLDSTDAQVGLSHYLPATKTTRLASGFYCCFYG